MTTNKKIDKKSKFKLAIAITHPIQYQVPLFRCLGKHPRINLTVYYFSNKGATEYFDHEMGTKLKWDRPMLADYNYKFIRNYSPFNRSSGYFAYINPSIINELLLNNYDAVIIHGYSLFSYLLAYIGAWISSTPIIFRGETVLRTNSSFFRSKCKDIYLEWLFKKTKVFLSIIQKSTEFYKHYDVPSNKIIYAPYSVDNEFFIKEAQKWIGNASIIKRELGFDPNYPVILFVGKLIERKRPFDLLKAYEALNSNANLLMVGDGRLKAQMQEYCIQNRIERVSFPGFVNQSELPKYYAISDIFILPSVSSEVSPLVINEAMCCSLPIIVSDSVPSARDYIDDGVNGYIYPVGDVYRLNECLDKLVTDSNIRYEMGSNSLKHISNFSNTHTSSRILEALENINIE